MDKLNINSLLDRVESEQVFKKTLSYFESHKRELLTRRGIYIYGSPGSGKTRFVKDLLKSMNYDIVMYDAGDVRNKSVIDTITKHNMSDTNVLSLLKKKVKKIAIVMDEIDGMSSNDRGGVSELMEIMMIH